MNHFHGFVAGKTIQINSTRMPCLVFAFKKLFAAKEMTMAKKNFVIRADFFFFWSDKLKRNGLKINGLVRKLSKRLAPYLKIISPE